MHRSFTDECLGSYKSLDVWNSGGSGKKEMLNHNTVATEADARLTWSYESGRSFGIVQSRDKETESLFLCFISVFAIHHIMGRDKAFGKAPSCV